MCDGYVCLFVHEMKVDKYHIESLAGRKFGELRAIFQTKTIQISTYNYNLLADESIHSPNLFSPNLLRTEFTKLYAHQTFLLYGRKIVPVFVHVFSSMNQELFSTDNRRGKGDDDNFCFYLCLDLHIYHQPSLITKSLYGRASPTMYIVGKYLIWWFGGIRASLKLPNSLSSN